jgi:putative toxin-antitoxin system antitoxin component (TIGR02293 family)
LVTKKAAHPTPASPNPATSDEPVDIMHDLAESLKSAKKPKRVKFMRKPAESEGGRVVHHGSLAPRHSEQLIQDVINIATEVLGDKDEALRWLGTPVRGLDFATPVSLLGSERGFERVCDMLGQMEHGIW